VSDNRTRSKSEQMRWQREARIKAKGEQLRADYLAKVEAAAKPKSTLEMVGVTPSSVMGCGVLSGIVIGITILVSVISITDGASDLVAEEKREVWIAGIVFIALVVVAIRAFVRSNRRRQG
jgi:hypothetical protein